jgi:hypothetical protein
VVNSLAVAVHNIDLVAVRVEVDTDELLESREDRVGVLGHRAHSERGASVLVDHQELMCKAAVLDAGHSDGVER